VATGRLLGTEAQNTIQPYSKLSKDHISQIAVFSLVTCLTIRILKSDYFSECCREHLVGVMFETTFCETNPIVNLTKKKQLRY
jgi:hypothetical protein